MQRPLQATHETTPRIVDAADPATAVPASRGRAARCAPLPTPDELRSRRQLSRTLLLEIAELGVACGSELLDPIAACYLEDLLSWAAIGARTATSQTHRELASRLAMPVGFKNGVDGSIASGVHGALSARNPHTSFAIDGAGRASRIHSIGNGAAHLVLRGGGGRTNHESACVTEAVHLARDLSLARPDCSHDNGGKDHERQADVCLDVLAHVRAGRASIAGLMLEGHLEAGRQIWAPGEPALPNRSLTEACIGWDRTSELLQKAAACVQNARRRRP